MYQKAVDDLREAVFEVALEVDSPNSNVAELIHVPAECLSTETENECINRIADLVDFKLVNQYGSK